jgi:hypothetical protein
MCALGLQSTAYGLIFVARTPAFARRLLSAGAFRAFKRSDPNGLQQPKELRSQQRLRLRKNFRKLRE